MPGDSAWCSRSRREVRAGCPSEHYAGGSLITSRFEKVGKFKFSLKRTATSTRHVTLRFCGYLERTKVAPDKTTTTYTTK